VGSILWVGVPAIGQIQTLRKVWECAKSGKKNVTTHANESRIVELRTPSPKVLRRMRSIMAELTLSILRPLEINGRHRKFSRWEELDHVLRGEQAFFVMAQERKAR
jgi:hypothetical protein